MRGDFYTDPEDMAPIEIGDHTWEGFSVHPEYTSSEVSPLTVIWTTIGSDVLQVVGFAPKGARDEAAHTDLNNPEIIAIISSITLD